MTVKELIEELEKHDPNRIAFIYSETCCECHCEAERVEDDVREERCAAGVTDRKRVVYITG